MHNYTNKGVRDIKKYAINSGCANNMHLTSSIKGYAGEHVHSTWSQ